MTNPNSLSFNFSKTPSPNQPLINALLSSFNQHRPQLHGKRIWLACSGGRDSLSLAQLCVTLFDAGRLPFLPQLLHVNHGMQAANAMWAQHVQTWAERHTVPYHVFNINLSEKTERAARQARYEVMMNIMNHGDVLLLGHHMDDQVETVLMRLFNGAGVNGLSGMREWRVKQTDVNATKTVYLWRPWLSISRAQITAYADASELDYIDDPTNVATVIANKPFDLNKTSITNDRAWLRSVIMPLIYKRYPNANTAIYRTSQLLHDASLIVDNQAQLDLLHVSITDISTSTATQSSSALCAIIAIDKLLILPFARQSNLIHKWLSSNSLELPPSKRLVDEVLNLCQRSDNNHQTALSWNSSIYQYEIRRYQNKLYRLRKDWLKWLNLAPLSQQVQLNVEMADTLCLKTLLLSDELDMESVIVWQISGLQQLSKGLQNTGLKNVWLQFESLPRGLKLCLKGRSGRKSGKKLLQAINQPSFMRKSVVLMSLLPSLQSESLSSEKTIPIAIVCVDRVYALDSKVAECVASLQPSLTVV